MKSLKSLFPLLILLVFVACSNENELDEHQGCIDEFLEQFNMNSFNGVEIQCGKNYLVLFENSTTTLQYSTMIVQIFNINS